jgi:hypothetical protein
MPKERNPKSEGTRQEGGEIDREVLDVIQEEKRKGSRRGPQDTTEARKKRKLAEDGLRAIKAKDARAFTELLLQAGIREGSPEWKNAWKAFYSA